MFFTNQLLSRWSGSQFQTQTQADLRLSFKNQTGLCVTSPLITLKENQDASLATLNVLPHKVAVQKNSVIARITILTPKQAEYVKPINHQLVSNYFNQNINSIIQDSEIKVLPSSDEF